MIVVLILAILSSGLLFLFKRPDYILLPIPSVSSQNGEGDWMKVEQSHLEMDHGDFYIVKKYEIVFTQTGENKNYASPEAIVSYYDTWLMNHNWRKFQGDLPQPCFILLSESDFLPQGENGFTTYFEKDSKDAFLNQPTVCLAVWSNKMGETTRKNSVILLTANPSTRTTILNIFR